MDNFFSSNLKFLRAKSGLNQLEVATALGLSRSTYANYEVAHSEPSLSKIVEISSYFGTSVENFVTFDLSKVKVTPKSDVQDFTNNDKVNVKVTAKVNAENEANLPDIGTAQTPFKNGKKGAMEPQIKEIIRPVMVTVDHQGRENIVMVPVKARAGYLNGYGDSKYIQKLPAYRLPGLNHGTFRMFEVEGLSNYPTLNDKDIVIGSYVEQARLIRDDRMHIVVTRNQGVVIKRVLNRVEKEGKIILKSDNYQDRHLYPPVVLNPEDILEVWYCQMRLTRQFGSNDLYTRLVDLEGRLTMLEQSGSKMEP